MRSNHKSVIVREGLIGHNVALFDHSKNIHVRRRNVKVYKRVESFYLN
jgi:hypothetical protein